MLRNTTSQTRYGPQTLGSGRTTLNIERYVNATSVPEQATILIGQILTGEFEFVNKMTQYRYFKLMGIVIVFEPNSTGTGSQRIFIQMNWDGNEADNMETEDSTKVVPTYRTRRVVLKFLPPNIMTTDGVGYINYKSWVTRNIYNLNPYLPGSISYKASESGLPVSFKVVLRVKFAGSVSVTPSKMQECISYYESLKKYKVEGKTLILTKDKEKEEDEKEEEKEEEEEESDSEYEGDEEFIKSLDP